MHLNLEVQGRTYENTMLEVIPQACADVILGQKFLSVYEAIVFEFGGKARSVGCSSYNTRKSIVSYCSKSGGTTFIRIYATQLQAHSYTELILQQGRPDVY